MDVFGFQKFHKIWLSFLPKITWIFQLQNKIFQAQLSPLSPLLREALINSQEEDVCLIIPDIEGFVIQEFLELAYGTKKADDISEEMQFLVNELCFQLGIIKSLSTPRTKVISDNIEVDKSVQNDEPMKEVTAGNASSIEQVTPGNSSSIDQVTAGNSSSIDQVTPGNSSSIDQVTPVNSSSIDQFPMEIDESVSSNLHLDSSMIDQNKTNFNESQLEVSELINDNLNSENRKFIQMTGADNSIQIFEIVGEANLESILGGATDIQNFTNNFSALTDNDSVAFKSNHLSSNHSIIQPSNSPIIQSSNSPIIQPSNLPIIQSSGVPNEEISNISIENLVERTKDDSNEISKNNVPKSSTGERVSNEIIGTNLETQTNILTPSKDNSVSYQEQSKENIALNKDNAFERIVTSMEETTIAKTELNDLTTISDHVSNSIKDTSVGNPPENNILDESVIQQPNQMNVENKIQENKNVLKIYDGIKDMLSILEDVVQADRIEICGKEIKGFECPNCKEHFDIPNWNLHKWLHKLSSNFNNTMLLKCQECDLQLSSDVEMRYHLHKDHAKKLEFQCLDCGELFETPKALYEHNVTDHPGTKTKIQCSKCKEYFKGKSAHKRHYEYCTGMTVFECHYCGKVYNRKDTLAIHLTRHSGAKIDCEFCDKKFRTQNDLYKHKKRKHDKETGYNSAYIAQCDICGRKFSDLGKSYQDHINYHAGIKTYECDICQKMFSTQVSLRDHLQQHSNVNTHACNICHQEFRRIQNIRQHIMTSHRITDQKAIRNNITRLFLYGVDKLRAIHELGEGI